MQRVINFSGGKTSALMTILEYKQGDLVIFCDTGREHPKTYKFINDFEAFENIPIIRLTYEGGFNALIKKKKAIPNQAKRFCTIELKIKTARRYLRSLKIMKYENLVGFRHDEQLRIKRRKQYWKTVKDVFPLNDYKLTKHHVNEYWKRKPYTLELEPILGNCVMCFQKGKDALISILMQYPEYANEWIEDEKLMNYTYLKDYSMEELLKIANYMKGVKQIDLFEVQPAFDCDCQA